MPEEDRARHQDLRTIGQVLPPEEAQHRGVNGGLRRGSQPIKGLANAQGQVLLQLKGLGGQNLEEECDRWLSANPGNGRDHRALAMKVSLRIELLELGNH